MLQEIDKEDTSPSLRSMRFSKLEIVYEILCAKIQSPVWSRQVGVPPWDTNTVAGKWGKHLVLTDRLSVLDRYGDKRVCSFLSHTAIALKLKKCAGFQIKQATELKSCKQI